MDMRGLSVGAGGGYLSAARVACGIAFKLHKYGV